MEALRVAGIDRPFPIQAATLPDSLAGRDVLGRGRTGSGKTLAFALPVVARLVASGRKRTPNRPRALILAPTRELASQIHATILPLAKALSLRTATVFGGVGASPQIAALRGGLDILVACPGRLEEHVRDGVAKLDSIEVTVLDEADHMCDLGFLPVVKRLMDGTPAHSQRLLFSATLDAGVDGLVRKYLHDPVTHSVDPETSSVVEMTHHVLHIPLAERLPVLVELASNSSRTIVFTRTKHRAKQLTKQLNASGVPAVELHGNLAQNARVRNLAAFSDGSASTMVATDIAARGIHVDEIALVVHADPPEEHKAYLHRSGRTARAGASGTVITLMTDEQASDVRTLARKAGINPTITRVERSHPILRQLAEGTAETSGPGIAPRPPATDVVRTPRPGARPSPSGRPARGPRTDDTRGPRPDRQPGAARRRGERPAGPSGNAARTPGNGGGNGSGPTGAPGRSRSPQRPNGAAPTNGAPRPSGDRSSAPRSAGAPRPGAQPTPAGAGKQARQRRRVRGAGPAARG